MLIKNDFYQVKRDVCKKYGMKCFTSFITRFSVDLGLGENILFRQSRLFDPFLMTQLTKPLKFKNVEKQVKYCKRLAFHSLQVR